MFQRYFWAIALFVVILLTRCQKAQTIGLFNSNDATALSVQSTDTFSVVTSTVALDSVPTNNVGAYNDSCILVGRAIDPLLGTISAKSFFQINGTNAGVRWDLSSYRADNQIRFDSIVLYLKYNISNVRYEDIGRYPTKPLTPSNSYYQTYGDTTQKMTLQLYQLTQQLLKNQVKNNIFTGGLTAPLFYASFIGQTNPLALFNTSSGVYDPNVIYASKVIQPHPRSIPDSIILRLPDTLGKSLLSFAQNNDSRVSNDIEFITHYLKGFALTVSSGSKGSILNFSPRQSKIKLYYKQNTNGVFLNRVHRFDINYTSNSNNDISNTLFNQILADRSGTSLAGIKPFTPIRASKTGDKTFIQSGSGLVTKIEFPYLQGFFQAHPNLIVNRAELIVSSDISNYNPSFRVPPFVELYYNNLSNFNVPVGELKIDFNSITPQIAYRQNVGILQSGYYKFYISQYFGSQVYKPQYDGTALFLGTPPISIFNSLDRMVIDNPLKNRNSIKLRVFYTQTNAN